MTRFQSTKHLRLGPLSHVVVLVDLDDAELSPAHREAMNALRAAVAALEEAPERGPESHAALLTGPSEGDGPTPGGLRVVPGTLRGSS